MHVHVCVHVCVHVRVCVMVENNEGLKRYLCHMFGIIVENNRVNRVGRALSLCHSFNTSEGPGLTDDHQTDIPQ